MSQPPVIPQPAVEPQAAKPVPPQPPLVKTWKFWSAVLLILIIGALSWFYEGVKDQLPWLVTLQLWTYGKMSHAQARVSRPKWVVPVEVDNRSFFGPPMNRRGPEDITDRKFIAQVVNNAVKGNATVIALDINLVREETNAESNADADNALWQAIQNASARSRRRLCAPCRF